MALRILSLYDQRELPTGALLKDMVENTTFLKRHAERIADISELLARRMHLNEDEINIVVLASLGHDIGKRADSTMVQLVNTKRRLSQEEFDTVCKHPDLSVFIIEKSDISLPLEAKKAILYHHNPSGINEDHDLKEQRLKERVRKFVDILIITGIIDDFTGERKVYLEESSSDPYVVDIKGSISSELERVKATTGLNSQCYDLIMGAMPEAESISRATEGAKSFKEALFDCLKADRPAQSITPTVAQRGTHEQRGVSAAKEKDILGENILCILTSGWRVESEIVSEIVNKLFS